MATVIRFARHGTKKKPYYRIVVQDQRSPRDGRFVEHIGAYDPVRGDETLVIKRDRLEYWLSTGAQLSDSVKNRLKVAKKAWAQAEGSAPAVPEAGAKPHAGSPKPRKDAAKEPPAKEA